MLQLRKAAVVYNASRFFLMSRAGLRVKAEGSSQRHVDNSPFELAYCVFQQHVNMGNAFISAGRAPLVHWRGFETVQYLLSTPSTSCTDKCCTYYQSWHLPSPKNRLLKGPPDLMTSSIMTMHRFPSLESEMSLFASTMPLLTTMI